MKEARRFAFFCLDLVCFTVVSLILPVSCNGSSDVPSAFIFPVPFKSSIPTRSLQSVKIEQQQPPGIKTDNYKKRNGLFFPPLLKAATSASGEENEGDDTTTTIVTQTSNDYDEILRNALERMAIIMNPEYVASQSSLLKQMQNDIIKNVQIKESSIPNAGLGLFATKNIKAGTIVGFYPAHALGLEDATTGKELFVCDEADKDHFQNALHATSGYLHATDQPIFNRPSLLTKAVGDEVTTKSIPL